MLNEKTLSREIKHLKEDEYAILTAWRSKKSVKDNMRNMTAIGKDIQKMGHGFVDMHGVGQEHDGPSIEKSLLVINGDKRKGFKEEMLNLAKKYEQDYIVHGKGGIGYLVNVATGEQEMQMDKVEPGKSEYYSAVKGVKNDKQTFHLTSESRVMTFSKFVTGL